MGHEMFEAKIGREDRIEFYRAKAAKAEEKAAKAHLALVRVTWEQIAHSWRVVADHASEESKTAAPATRTDKAE